MPDDWHPVVMPESCVFLDPICGWIKALAWTNCESFRWTVTAEEYIKEMSRRCLVKCDVSDNGIHWTRTVVVHVSDRSDYPIVDYEGNCWRMMR
jgi:hypothetical protein